LKVPAFDLDPSKVEIRESLPKLSETAKKKKDLSIPSIDAKVDPKLKEDDKKLQSSSSSSSKIGKKKKGDVLLNVEGKLKTPEIEKAG
jgi:hypothetical protein